MKNLTRLASLSCLAALGLLAGCSAGRTTTEGASVTTTTKADGKSCCGDKAASTTCTDSGEKSGTACPMTGTSKSNN